MTELGRGEWLRLIRRRLQHGVPPLTHDECVRLYEIATGDTIEKRRRCPTCDGEGKALEMSDLFRRKLMGFPFHVTTCPDCQGKGYTVLKTADF